MGIKLSLAKRTLIVLPVFALVAIGYFSNALAQTRTLSCQRADGTWYEGECKPSGGDVPGGGHRGPDVLDALIDNVIGPLLGYSSPAEYARKKRAYDLHEEGRRLSGQGDRRGALVKYREALALDPSDKVIRFNIANNESVLAHEAGDLPLAIAKAREGIPYTDNPAFRKWLKGLEEELADKTSWQEANYYHERGRKLFDEGKYADAEAAFREAMRLRPNNWAFPYNLGLALEYQNRVADAEAAYQKAVELNPKDSNGHFRLALMRIYLGQYARAEKAYRAAAQLAPSQSGTRVGLGYALEKQGYRVEAEAQYREAIRLAPGDYFGYFRLGELLRTSKKHAEAEDLHREAVRLEPKDADARFGLAYTLMEQGKRAEAETQYREVIRLYPKSLGARLNLAKSLLDRNQAREAESLLREVIKLSPRDMDAYNSLGRALKRQGRYREAEAAYGKALEIDPSDELAQDNLKAMRGAIESKADSIWSTIFPAEQPATGSLQPFPSGNADVSPATSASSAPRVERTGGGTAIEQAKGASEYGKSALDAGSSGGTVPSKEPVSDKARTVFDTPGRGVSDPRDAVVDVSTIATREIPPELANHPRIKALQKEKETLEGQKKSLEKELGLIRQKKARGEGNKGDLEVQEAKKKQEISNVTSKIGVVDVNLQSFVINLTRASTPSGKKFQVEFDEESLPKQQPTRPPAERRP